MRLFDLVKLDLDLPEHGLVAGAIGTLVHELVTGRVYLVEFDHDVVELTTDQISLHLPVFQPNEYVVLLDNLPEHHLRRGQVGRILRYNAERCHVIFTNKNGNIETSVDVPTHALMVLYGLPVQQNA